MGVAANTANDFFGEITCHPFFHAGGWRDRGKKRRWRGGREVEGEEGGERGEGGGREGRGRRERGERERGGGREGGDRGKEMRESGGREEIKFEQVRRGKGKKEEREEALVALTESRCCVYNLRPSFSSDCSLTSSSGRTCCLLYWRQRFTIT